jgi:phage/plasmid-associated DNA primase
LPGILNWALKGVDMLKKTGFVKTKEHSEIMKEYREESNSFEAFIADCTESSEGSVITSDDLYSNYTQYCVKNGFKMVGKKQTLTKIMKQKSTRGLCQYLPRKNNKEENSFEGIQLTQEWESAKWNHVTSNTLRSSQA